MKNSIYPCFWFDDKAKEAAELYCSAFDDAEIIDDSPMVVTFQLAGVKFMGLNGGPLYKPNATMSLYVTLESEAELQHAWHLLSQGGFVFMPLDTYDWSEKYGWIQDRYGISWQLSLGDSKTVGQRFIPLLMFCGEHQGQAQQAIDHYISIFDKTEIDMIARYEPGQVAKGHDATVVHARFKLKGSPFMAMDSGVAQPFTFTEGVSLVIECETQADVDYYWDKLTDGGAEGMCGWLKDRFGVSWQVVPTVLPELLKDPERSERVTEAFMKMKKFDINTLLNA